MTDVETRPAPEIVDVLALSPLQEGFFSLSRIADGGLDLYTMQFIVDIGGPLDVPALRRSLAGILDRHPNLRVSFWDRDIPRPVQIVPSHVDLPWREVETAAEDFEALAESERRTAFDLSAGPALRVLLATMPGDRRRMIITAHHILMDGWAVAVFFRELIAAYDASGSTEGLPAVRPYRDFIAWLAAQDRAAGIEKWVDYLRDIGEPPMLGNGADVHASVPECTRLTLGRSDTNRLTGVMRSAGLTMNTAVQLAWSVVSGRLTDRDDVVFGTVVSGRPEALAGAETMIGLFINTLPVRVRLDPGATVTEQCRSIQRASATMRDHGHLGLSEIQRAVGCGPLFDTLVVFENAPIGSATDPVVARDGTRFLPIAMESLAHYPLTVVCYLADGELVVVIEAIEHALGHLTGADIGARLLAVLRQLCDGDDRRVADLDVLLPSETLRHSASPTPVGNDSMTSALEAFAAQVASSPESPALTTAGHALTYRELDDAAGRLATEIVARGVRPGDVVALVAPRSVDSIVAILAVLRVGATYVPIDVSAPSVRIESILRQSTPVLVITDTAHHHLVAGAIESVVLDDAATAAAIAAHTATTPVPVHPDQGAYIIFTSGSTGEPKGVIGTHRALASYFADHCSRIYRPAAARLGRPLRIAHAWSLGFDASWQPLLGLLDGHRVHLFDTDEMRDAHRIVGGIVDHHLDMIDTSPSMVAPLRAAGVFDEAPGRTPLAVLALGGEAIGATLWAQLQRLPDTAVFNCYGPTETTVEAVVARIDSSTPEPTIGLPVKGMAAYVLDSRLRRVPTGVVGELYLSGAQVTRGYVGRHADTATRYVADPFRPGHRMYRTGDLVRHNQTGHLLFQGRSDSQVKIRGHRIEIGEIETVLMTLPGVREAAVVVLPRHGGPALIGVVVVDDHEAVDDQPATAHRRRAIVADRLPAYMVPARVLAVETMPLTVNGKLDEQALIARARRSIAASGGTAAPATPTEEVLVAVFAESLDTRAPGVDTDIAGLGIDSIVAMSVVSTARDRGLAITPRMVLDHPTIADLAAAVDDRAARADADRVFDSQTTGPGEVVPIPVVDWMLRHPPFRRFTQTAVITLPRSIDRPRLESVLQNLIDGHDMVRAQVTDDAGTARVFTRDVGSVMAADILTETVVPDDDTESADAQSPVADAVQKAATDLVGRIDCDRGQMIAATWLRSSARSVGPDTPDVLVLTVHHLAADAVSWHIAFADLSAAWARIESGRPPVPAVEATTFREWSAMVRARADAPDVRAQEQYWLAQVVGPDPLLGSRPLDPAVDTASTMAVTESIVPVDVTASIVDASRNIGVHEALLTAVTLALSSMRSDLESRRAGVLLAIRGHGRDDDVVGAGDGRAPADTVATMGWFNSVYPARLGVGSDLDVAAATVEPHRVLRLLAAVTDHLADVPARGADHAVLRQIAGVPALVAAAEPQVEVNYLGRFDLRQEGRAAQDAAWTPVTDPAITDRLPRTPEPEQPLRYPLELIAVVRDAGAGPEILTQWRYASALVERSTADAIVAHFDRAIALLAAAPGSPSGALDPERQLRLGNPQVH